MKQILLSIILFLFIATTANATSIDLNNYSWTWTDPRNNVHTYTVEFGGYDWDTAWTKMENEYGNDAYLATITSLDEQLAMAGALDAFYQINQRKFSGEFWLGGVQKDDQNYAEDEGWEWATGEAFSFTYWQDGEPNDWTIYNERHLGTKSRYDNWQWNDEHGNANIKGYIVETGTLYANPEPATMLLFGFGLIFIAGVGRKKYMLS